MLQYFLGLGAYVTVNQSVCKLLHHELGIIYSYIFRCFDDGSLGHTVRLQN